METATSVIQGTDTPTIPAEGQVTETKEAAAPEATEAKDDEFSPKFAALARKEKAILKRSQEVKQMENNIKKMQSDLEAKMAKLTDLENRGKTDPDYALEALGWDYDKYLNYRLNDKQVTPDHRVNDLEKRLESMKKEAEERELQRDQKAKEDAERQYSDQISAFKTQIKDFVTEKQSEYELINLYDASETVFETIQAYHQQHKKLLNVKEASDLVEKFLEDQAEEKYMKSTKLKAKFGIPVEKKEEKKQPPTSTTLSGTINTSVGSMLPAKNEQDRLRRALAALEKNG